MPGLDIYIVSISIFLVISLWRKILTRRSDLNYPPGPPGRILIGNLRDIPDKKPWMAYAEWAKTYGDIMHLQAINDHIIVLNSVKVANDLLDKRSRIYSGRPYEDIAEMSGWSFSLAGQTYSDNWRKNRRLYQQNFRPDAVVELHPAIQQSIGTFLRNLSSSPEKFMDHIDVLSSGLALKIMYGVNVSTRDDPLISVAKSAVHTSDIIFEPYCIAVLRYCPFIMSIPRWVPVLGRVRRQVEIGREYLSDLQELPLQRAQRNEDTGVENDGIVPSLLRGLDIGDVNSMEKVRRSKDMASTIYAAAADTTMSSIGTFFLAMTRNTHSQKMAQEEIDAVVGKGRLPNLGDRGRLPYVDAVYQEVMRWYPAVPMGVPHMTTEPDEYNGYFIPQGAMVFANIWAMTHDEEVFSEPYDFKPERFLNANTNINDVLAYGFGRRICVGRHLADAVLWLSFASVLACFNIEKEIDEYGNEIEPPEKYSDGPGLFSHPLPFHCKITPRHTGVESSIS